MHIAGNGGIVAKGGIGTCPCCDCPHPLMAVTMSWVDADLTKTYLGKVFTNGQTRLICPDFYSCSTGNPGTAYYISYGGEGWRHSTNAILNGNVKIIDKQFVESKSAPVVTQTNTSTPNVTQNKLHLFNTWKNVWPYYPATTTNKRLYYQRKSAGFVENTDTAFQTTTHRKFYQYYRRSTLVFPASTTFTWFRRWGVNGTPSPPVTPLLQETTITDAFEGTFTTGNGVTISWQKSNAGTAQWGSCKTP